MYIREEIKVNWISIKDKLPPDGQLVQTKIDDENGVRNETQLIFKNNLWWFPIRTAVYGKNIFHYSHKLSILLRRNAPTLFQIRLTFIFLSTDETVE